MTEELHTYTEHATRAYPCGCQHQIEREFFVHEDEDPRLNAERIVNEAVSCPDARELLYALGNARHEMVVARNRTNNTRPGAVMAAESKLEEPRQEVEQHYREQEPKVVER